MNDWISTTQFEELVSKSFNVPEIQPEFVDHLYMDLMQRAAVKVSAPKKSFLSRRSQMFALALILFLMLVILVIGPQRVYAAAVQLLGYIPGVGIVDKSTPIRVLAEPVSRTREGITITVTSATLTNNRTHIVYRIFGVPGSAYSGREDVSGCTQRETLRLPDGTILNHIDNDFMPIPDGLNQAVLVIPCIFDTLPGKVPENWELPLQFVSAPPDMTVVPVTEILPTPSPSMPENTPTAVSNKPQNTPASLIDPLIITKVLDIGDKYVLMGEFAYNAQKDPSASTGSWWAINRISIIGADGRDVPQSYSNDFAPPLPTRQDSETWLYELDKNFIPPVTITYSGEIITPVGIKEQAEFEFDAGANPQNGGQWTVNHDFKLGGYNIRLVSIESNSRGYVFHFKSDPGASANAINVELVGYTPNCGGGGGGNLFTEEFTESVCYGKEKDSPEFPHGPLKVILNFQTLERQKKSFQIQWSPNTSQTGLFTTSTPKPGVCLNSASMSQLPPTPPDLSKGMALMYEQLDAANHWGLVLYNLDGSRKQVLVKDGNWGALSPDGRKVAYLAQENGLHLMDLESQTVKILPGVDGFNLHWSPDGKQIAYIGMGKEIVDSLFIINSDGGKPKQISDWSNESVVGWSPDGSKLYFAVPFTGGAAWKVFNMDLGSHIKQELFTIENGTPKFLNPKLSADGNWIAYRGRDNSSLYLVHPDGSAMHLVMDNMGVVGIEWSHSGWLGVSVRKENSDESMVLLFNPDNCTAYRLPDNFHGELEGLYIP